MLSNTDRARGRSTTVQRIVFGWAVAVGLITIGDATLSAADLKVAFWNVENLFDAHDDPQLPAEDLLTSRQVTEKLAKDAAVIQHLDADIIGLMEVENHQVLRELVARHLFDRGYYFFTLLEGKDTRGIDVAIISKRPFLVRSFAIPNFPRGILAARFTADGKPFYVLVNHWKSRRNGGEAARIEAAKTVVQIIKRELHAYEGQSVPVIVGGDLNDTDDDESLRILKQSGLTNTLEDLSDAKRWTIGHFENDRMSLLGFDHILVTSDAVNGPLLKLRSAGVARPSFMINRRTINGNRYEMPLDDYRDRIGYSDHFPVTAVFSLTE